MAGSMPEGGVSMKEGRRSCAGSERLKKRGRR